MQDQLDFVCT